MTLNLKKISEKRRAVTEAPEHGERRAPSAAASGDPLWHGRGAPPPRGSTWDQYLDWACEGGFERDGDASLALRFWRGLEPREEDAPMPPAPRK